jgi:hypothetical protein
MNHDVPSRWNLRLVAPQDLPDAAANAVAHYRAAHGFLNADAEAAARARPELLARVAGRERLLRAKEKGELRARTAVSRAINGFEVGSAQQPGGARKILPRAVRSA